MEGVKLAVTDFVDTILTVQVLPDAVSHPFQLEKAELLVGVAVRMTSVPGRKLASHITTQLVMPDGELVTLPPPLPAVVRVSVAPRTVKLFTLVPMPPGVATEIGPLEPPDGTVA